MAWYAIRPMQWVGRQVQPGDLLVADGDEPPCSMEPRRDAGLVIEVAPGQRLESYSDGALWRVVDGVSQNNTPVQPPEPRVVPVAKKPATMYGKTSRGGKG